MRGIQYDAVLVVGRGDDIDEVVFHLFGLECTESELRDFLLNRVYPNLRGVTVTIFVIDIFNLLMVVTVTGHEQVYRARTRSLHIMACSFEIAVTVSAVIGHRVFCTEVKFIHVLRIGCKIKGINGVAVNTYHGAVHQRLYANLVNTLPERTVSLTVDRGQ